MRRSLIAALALVLVATPLTALAVTDVAGQDRSLKAMLLPQNESPIVLTECRAALGGGVNAAGGEVGRTFAYEGVKIRNVSAKIATAIRFRFDFFDQFDGELKYANQLSSIEGKYSPNIDVDLMSQTVRAGFFSMRAKNQATFMSANLGGNGTDRILCSIDSVRFADGSVWHANYALERKSANGRFPTSP